MVLDNRGKPTEQAVQHLHSGQRLRPPHEIVRLAPDLRLAARRESDQHAPENREPQRCRHEVVGNEVAILQRRRSGSRRRRGHLAGCHCFFFFFWLWEAKR